MPVNEKFKVCIKPWSPYIIRCNMHDERTKQKLYIWIVFMRGSLEESSTQLFKGFPWFTRWFCLFNFTTVPNGDSGQSGLTLQLFPLETIVTSNLIGQNNLNIQWKCFIQLGAECLTLYFFSMLNSNVSAMCFCVFTLPLWTHYSTRYSVTSVQNRRHIGIIYVKCYSSFHLRDYVSALSDRHSACLSVCMVQSLCPSGEIPCICLYILLRYIHMYFPFLCFCPAHISLNVKSIAMTLYILID